MKQTKDGPKLLVIECNGTPRSGKGTITTKLPDYFPGAKRDETGIDYRAIVFGLLEDGILTPGMNATEVEDTIKKLTVEDFASYVKNRQKTIEERGEASFYSVEVHSLLGLVGPHSDVRTAVKAAFVKRVEDYVADTDTQFLFLDGRNLYPLVQKVSGAELLLRIFVDCQPFVAALREALRNHKDITNKQTEKWYREAIISIKNRQTADAKRVLDPVKKDPNSINYWFNTEVQYETAERVATERNMLFAEAAALLASDREVGRYGVGAKAVAENSQVYFNTTEVTMEAMIAQAKRMVEEALAQHNGDYRPASEFLITN